MLVKIAYLILAHAYPLQLQRLIQRIANDNADCYIHIDKKVDLNPFEEILSNYNVTFVKNRVKVKWASYSIIEATLTGFRQILESGIAYSHVTLLSGQDYPIKNNTEIVHFISQHPEGVFMDFQQVELEWAEALPRINKYHLVHYNIPFGAYTLENMLTKVLPRRKLPNGIVAVGRSQWFTACVASIAYLVDYIENNSWVKEFFLLSWAPDEMVFQTILYNSHFREQMINNNLVYLDWSANQPSPKVLTMDDATALATSNKLFARKFAIDTDSTILDYIDGLIADKSQI